MLIETYNDLVEGGRVLEVSVRSGMIHIRLAGGRAVCAESFRLDSEEVDRLAAALVAAKAVVRKERKWKNY